MRKVVAAILLAQAALVAAVAVAVRSRGVPLGVPGEWEWLRLPIAPHWFGVLFAGTAVAAFATFAGLGFRSLGPNPSKLREAVWVSGLTAATVAVQVVATFGAPDEYDLTKWAYVPFFPASTGYFTVARQQIHDPARFLAEYPGWIKRQDSLHVGTHPPGLFLAATTLRRSMESHPAAARFVVDHAPGPVWEGLRYLGRKEGLSLADQAALALSSLVTCLACAATVVPLYLLARASLSAQASWSAAALWGLVPSAILYQPVSDTAFPLLSTTALALAAHAGQARPGAGRMLAFAAGLVLAAGTFLTLAFFPVGLIAGIVLATSPGITVTRRFVLVGLTGAGFLAVTLVLRALTRADPFVIWWWNQKNHARFYVEYPRTYLAWVLLNPVEFLVGLGLPAAVWAGLGFAGARQAPRASWATLAVLVLLDLSGKNLSETPRLWLPMMPPLLAAAGFGLTRLGGGPVALALTVALAGAETLALEAAIQVVYPVVPKAGGPSDSKEHAGHADAQLGVDLDQLAARDQAAPGRQLHRLAAVPAQLEHVAGLQVGEPAERQVDPAELDGQRDGHVGRRQAAGRLRRRGVVRRVHGNGLPGLRRSLQGSADGHATAAGVGRRLGRQGVPDSRPGQAEHQVDRPARTLCGASQSRIDER
jgi:hypothetical protein